MHRAALTVPPADDIAQGLDELSALVREALDVPHCCIYAAKLELAVCPTDRAYARQTLAERTPCALVARDGGPLSFFGRKVEAPPHTTRERGTEARMENMSAFMGPERIMFYRAVPLLRSDGDVLGALSIFARETYESRANEDALLDHFGRVVSRYCAAQEHARSTRERLVELSVEATAQRKLLETAPGFFFTLSPDDRLVKIHGFPPTESTAHAARLAGLPVYDALPYPLAELICFAAKLARSEDQEQRLEYSFDGPHGRYFCDTHVVADARGNALFLAFDVTRRVVAEHQAREREELISAIAKAQDAFITGEKSREIFDKILRRMMLFTNSAMGFLAEVRRTGRGLPSLVPLVARNWPSGTTLLVRLNDREGSCGAERGLLELVNDAMLDGTARVINRGDGPPFEQLLPLVFERCQSLAVVPLVKGGEVMGILVVANRPVGYERASLDFLKPYLSTSANILGAYRAELSRQESDLALTASEGRLRAIVDTAADVIVSMSDDGTIEDINPAVTALLHYDPSELRGRSIHEVIAKERAGELRSQPDGTSRERPLPLGLARDTEARRRDGVMVPVELGISALTVGDRRMFTAIIRDVTTRRRLEQAKSEFVSAVSHELRTPLTSIRGALGLLVGGVVGEIPEEARAMISIAFKNSDRLVRLINDILDVEKAGSPDTTVELRTVRLIDAVQASVEALAGYAFEHDVQLVFQTRLKTAHVSANEDRLAQVLANIISNAIKFSPSEGMVTVRVVEAGTKYVVQVSDHGPGIPESFKPRVFQRFAQADSSDSRSKGGTGLGLAIVRELVEQMHGRVWFESSSAGTTFFVELPAVESAALHSTPPTSRALLCSSDEACASLLERMLRSFGCVVETVDTAEAARARVSATSFDLVVLDTLLGEFAVARVIHDLSRNTLTRATRVVVVSADCDTHTLVSDMVISDVITRPLDAELVGATLRSAFLGWGPEAPSVLYVEDDEDLARMVQELLPPDWKLQFASTVREAKKLLSEQRFHAILLDLALPDGAGEELIACAGNTPIVVLSARELPEGLQNRVRAALVKTKVQERQIRYTLMQAVRRPSEPAEVQS